MLRLRTGSSVHAAQPRGGGWYPYTEAERAVIAEATASHIVGAPAEVVGALSHLAQRTGVDELMITTSTYDHTDRLESFRLLAAGAGLERGDERLAAPSP